MNDINKKDIKYIVDIINENIYIFKVNEESKTDIIYSSSHNIVYDIYLDNLIENLCSDNSDYIIDSTIVLHKSLDRKNVLDKLNIYVLDFGYSNGEPFTIFKKLTNEIFDVDLLAGLLFFYVDKENKTQLIPSNLISEILFCIFKIK